MMGMWGMLVMGIFWVALIVLVGWGLYRLLSSRRSGPPRDEPAHPRETPHDTLRRRYAAGEISTEEYEERKRRLDE